jgi:hypothetical protein
MSLMLWGRSEDSLSHVLVAPEFETGARDFFYPPPRACEFQLFKGLDENGLPIYESVSSVRAGVELADIPFIRLRVGIGGDLPVKKGFTDSVVHSQLLMTYLHEPPPLKLELAKGTVHLGKLSFHLSRQIMAVYGFFLMEFNNRPSAAGLEQLFDRRQVIANLERRIDRLKQGEQEHYAWEIMESLDDFRDRIRPCISKVNRAIDSAVGKNSLAARYTIQTGGGYGVAISDFEVVDV